MSLKSFPPNSCMLLVPLITSLPAKWRLFPLQNRNLDSSWSPVCPQSPMPVSGIVSPAWTLIPMADHPTFPQSHAASCPLWGWTSWMENKWVLSAAHSTSYDVCRFLNLTMPVKPKQDPEQRTQLTSQEMTGFSSVSHMPRCTVTDISYTLFDRHKLISLWNCKMRPDWQPKWWNWPETMTPAQVPENVVPQMCQCLSKLQKNLYDCKYFDKFMAV